MGRAERLERAPKHEAGASSSAETANAKEDRGQLQKENTELTREFEEMKDTVNSMAEILLDAEQRVATLQFEKEGMLTNNADLRPLRKQ
eukprot:2983132-Lingulodinium_polyedra.AAC.1